MKVSNSITGIDSSIASPDLSIEKTSTPTAFFNIWSRSNWHAARLPLVIYVAAFTLTLLAILGLNQGQFIYSLDDPYIHLALAENVFDGHYGVNLGEYSAPSSSILWPFLMALGAFSHLLIWMPLLVNFIFGMLSILVLQGVLQFGFPGNNKVISVALVFFVLCCNLVGVAFTGMEHSLQVLLSIGMIYGIFYIETQYAQKAAGEALKVPLMLYVLMVVAPLIRYECSIISFMTGLYLFYRGVFLPVILMGILVLTAFAGFSFYLESLGLGYLPSSILEKSSPAASSGGVVALLKNLLRNLYVSNSLIMLIAGVLLFRVFMQKKLQDIQGALAGIAVLGILLHFFLGRFGWFARYELYLLFPVLLILFFCYQDRVKLFVSGPKQHKWLLAYGFLFVATYTLTLIKTPISSNNIYEQQYQMHRLSTEYYQQPIAVNDLGWVSFRNDEYVLDLWGLASLEALQLRKESSDATWMQTLVEKHQIQLAMIYQNKLWFKELPEQWQLIGVLKTSRPAMINGDEEVKFFATNGKASEELISTLKIFQQSLPNGVTFSWASNN